MCDLCRKNWKIIDAIAREATKALASVHKNGPAAALVVLAEAVRTEANIENPEAAAAAARILDSIGVEGRTDALNFLARLRDAAEIGWQALGAVKHSKGDPDAEDMAPGLKEMGALAKMLAEGQASINPFAAPGKPTDPRLN